MGDVQTLSSVPNKFHLYNFGYGQLTIYRSFLILGSRRTLRMTTCHSNRIKVNKFFAVSYLFLLVLLAGDIQLNPGPGLVDTSVDNATGLLPHQRVEFPALDITGPFNSTPPRVPVDFRTLSTSEDGAWHRDLGIRTHDAVGTMEQEPACAVERLMEAGTVIDNKPGLAGALDCSADSVGWRRTAVLAKVRSLQTQALIKQRQTLFFQTVNHAKVVWDPTVKPKGILGGHLNI